MIIHKMKRIAYVVTVLVAGLASGQGQAATVNWGAEGGPNDFVSASINFTGFFADTLSSVSGQANYNTNNGALFPVTFTLEAELNGAWTNIFMGVTTGAAFLSNQISNVSFSFGEVTGLRATATGQMPGYVPLNNWALGPGFNPTVFNFSSVSQVPLPAALPLLAGGLGLMVVAGWRRRRKASERA